MTENFKVLFRNALSSFSFDHISDAFSSKASFILVIENELSTTSASLLSSSLTVASERLSSSRDSGLGGKEKNVVSP